MANRWREQQIAGQSLSMAAQMEETAGTARGEGCCGEDFAADGKKKLNLHNKP